jgi:hypothetical protein
VSRTAWARITEPTAHSWALVSTHSATAEQPARLPGRAVGQNQPGRREDGRQRRRRAAQLVAPSHGTPGSCADAGARPTRSAALASPSTIADNTAAQRSHSAPDSIPA